MVLADMKPTLKKGTGYHWDLVVSGLLAVVCSIFGLPWLCATVLQSKEHVGSLTVYNLLAPGQRPHPVKVVEQRMTALVLNALIGLSLMTIDVINNVPVAVLFGVFLYLGVTSLQSIQMLTRAVLFFIPVKYHPIHKYCLRVRTPRMHLYTAMQLIGLGLVMVIKNLKMTAFAFPFGIMVTVLFRHLVLPKIFTKVELIALDGEEDEDDHTE